MWKAGDFIFVAWFTYGEDTTSGQSWLTAQGTFDGSTADKVAAVEAEINTHLAQLTSHGKYPDSPGTIDKCF